MGLTKFYFLKKYLRRESGEARMRILIGVICKALPHFAANMRRGRAFTNRLMVDGIMSISAGKGRQKVSMAFSLMQEDNTGGAVRVLFIITRWTQKETTPTKEKLSDRHP
jgi:hypothetical protein